MKQLVSLFVLFAAMAIANPGQAQEKAKWTEMEAFHQVMSQTFHPSEEGKLEPIRSRSQEMVNAAISWKNSTAPAGYDKGMVNKSLGKLVKGAKKVNALVKKNASDKEIKEELSDLHNVFHQIVEKCEKGDGAESEHKM